MFVSSVHNIVLRIGVTFAMEAFLKSSLIPVSASLFYSCVIYFILFTCFSYCVNKLYFSQGLLCLIVLVFLGNMFSMFIIVSVGMCFLIIKREVLLFWLMILKWGQKISLFFFMLLWKPVYYLLYFLWYL